MRITVTGATGVLGRAAVPRLVAAGHDVVGLHRQVDGAAWLERTGAQSLRTDLFDATAVERVLDGADAVIHLATAIPPLARMTKARHWAANDRLRADATRVLADAARRVGVGQLVLASITFNYVDRGDRWISEDDPVEPVFAPAASALAAEDATAAFAATGGIGVSLRFARLYGPGGASAELVDALRSRRVPALGAGDNFVSSVHVDDAGSAVVAALTAPSGIYNVADDEPMRAGELLQLQARLVGAPPPRRFPVRLARMLGGTAVHQLTVSQRILNRRFRDTTRWEPAVPSVRVGWQTVLTEEPAGGRIR